MPRVAATSSCPMPANWRSSTTLAATGSSTASRSSASSRASRSLVRVLGGLVDEVDSPQPAAPLEPGLAPCRLDKDPPHRLGRRGEEVTAIVPDWDVARRRPVADRLHAPRPSAAACGRATRTSTSRRRVGGAPRRPEAASVPTTRARVGRRRDDCCDFGLHERFRRRRKFILEPIRVERLRSHLRERSGCGHEWASRNAHAVQSTKLTVPVRRS